MGFTIQQHSSTLHCKQTSMTQHGPTSPRTTTCLFAVKQKGNKKKKAKKSAGSGGGFGSSASSSSSSSSSSLETKVRSVSGHTGSGTKPLRQAANTFDTLRKAFGPESCNDVYIRSPMNDPTTFWFVGKVARNTQEDTKEEITFHGTSVPTIEEAVISQKRIILEYSKRELRPQNFGGKFALSLELWYAPGDSEMDVVQNKIALTKVNGSVSDISDGFHVKDVGFNPEIYVGDEIQQGGLRVKRDEEGQPIAAVFEGNIL